MMADRPILFSAPMIRALLAGTKTQTRRVAKVRNGVTLADITEWVEEPSGFRRGIIRRDHIADPLYAVGDRLYVREAWRSAAPLDDTSPRDMGDLLVPPIRYEADGESVNWMEWRGHDAGRFRQGMHMPRWASRLTLAVTDVRVQRLQDIREEDAEAEGAEPLLVPPDGGSAPHVEGYRVLWDSLNAGRGFGWETNPWIVAVSFSVERRNIDEVA